MKILKCMRRKKNIILLCLAISEKFRIGIEWQWQDYSYFLEVIGGNFFY